MTMKSAILAAAAVVPAIGFAASFAGADDAADLKSVSAFSSFANKDERSAALFIEAGKVIQHPRCVNCHPAGDRPLQGEDGHQHQPLAVRGEDGFGAIAMRCTTCHGEKNFDPGRVPGHPMWHLAPADMAWAGKSLGAICEQIKDPKRNGGMSLEKLVAHMAEDSLVGWAWTPGAGRSPAPGTQKAFGELIKAWSESGAVCPAS